MEVFILLKVVCIQQSNILTWGNSDVERAKDEISKSYVDCGTPQCYSFVERILAPCTCA